MEACADLGYNALKMIEKEDTTVPVYQQSINFFRKLPPTPQSFINDNVAGVTIDDFVVSGFSKRGATAWLVTLTTDHFAYGVRLSVPGSGARFSDNYMHLLPGDTVTVRIDPEGSDVDLTSRISLRTLWDVTRN